MLHFFSLTYSQLKNIGLKENIAFLSASACKQEVQAKSNQCDYVKLSQDIQMNRLQFCSVRNNKTTVH